MNNDDVTNLKIDLETMNVDAFLEKYNPPVNLEGKRFAYTIVVESTDKDGNYIPCVAIEGERGYRPLSGRGRCSAPWTWGKDYNKANEIADDLNKKMGLSKMEALKIVGSTMFGS